MCGIVGFIAEVTEPEANTWLRACVRSIKHRGPDGVGSDFRHSVGLGHARLAIIDPKGGVQPMFSDDRKFSITYNGEVYNFNELRTELEKIGHRFRTRSDTEVVLAAYQQWGADCVKKLRGMFAFAIADYDKRKLFVARDQLGIKPLVYTIVGNRFAFASEINALKTLPWVKQILEPDPQGLFFCLRFGYSTAPHSAYKQIHKLPPGHYMEVSFDSPNCTPKQYWNLEFHPDHSKSLSQWNEIIDNEIRNSVKAHLVSDVPFGAFLSGGLDSTLVVNYMSELMNEPVKTFTIGFTQDEYDERQYALTASDTLGTKHYEEVVTGSSMNLLPELVKHYGEPFGDSSAVPTWHVSKLAREHVPMVLTGDGGDEFFGGYNTYMNWLNHLHPNRAAWKTLLRPIFEKLHPGRFRPDSVVRAETLDRWLKHVNFTSQEQMKKLWRPELLNFAQSEPDIAIEAFEKTRGLDASTRSRNVDIHTYLPGSILTKVDIAAMMHGLETRTPLTDVRIAELAATIPPEFLFKKSIVDEETSFEGKIPIKNLLSDKFSDKFVHRKKQGFSVPVNQWLFEGRSLQETEGRLKDNSSPIYDWLRPTMVSEIVDKKQGNSTWNLLVFDEWLRQNDG